MLLKIVILVAFVSIAVADNALEDTKSVEFETSHKNPDAPSDEAFQTAHKISPFYLSAFTGENGDFGGLRFLRSAMSFAPTQARPELNPVLSALINEDVRKSIEAKRAIEQEELDAVRAEIDAAVAKVREEEAVEANTQAAPLPLTTAKPVKKANLQDDINVDFVDQTISLDTAGSENNKKSRIEIKKGPNGQEYEYEYVYYYEDEDEDSKTKAAADTAAAQTEDSNLRGKSRYTSIDRSNNAAPTENSLVSGKAKGRSSNVNAVADEIEAERLPTHTRFPNRGKNIEVQPTPSIDAQQEQKRISVKRPSLELVDSETFNTDEKQVKGSPRNGDTEAINKSAAQEQPARVEALNVDKVEVATPKIETDVETATNAALQKAPFDLYAISINEKLNSDFTTLANEAVTTALPESTDSEDSLTTLLESLPSSTTTSTTTTTTTTTTEAPTTTAKPGKASLFGNRRPGYGNSARRNKNKSTGEAGSTTTEASAASEQAKPGKNRFSRPSIGGRSRPAAKTTSAPAPTEEGEEEKVEVKEVKPVSSGFARNRPRNRFNLRGSTTEKPEESADEQQQQQQEEGSSTTARSLRSRPTLNLRGRTRASTTKAPAVTEEEENKNAESESEAKPAAAPVKSSRFNLNRPGGNRLLPRNKYGRTTEHPASEDSAADSSHHNDIKNEEHAENDAEKSDKKEAPAAGGNINRLKNRQRLQLKNEKSNAAPAPPAPRKVNPLLSKRRLQLGASTTEAPTLEEADGTSLVEETEAKESTNSTADENESAKEDSTEATETTTKQARGLGLLGQRRRLPLRKPGTIL